MSDLRDIETLVPYARNSRTHSPEQVDQLAASIDEFGFAGAIVVRDGTIAKGHGTMQAVRKLIKAGKAIYPPPGRKAVPPPEPFPPGMVPVIDASGWTESQFRAYVIADNKLSENAGWDDALLRIELDELNADGFDLGLTGFDLAELEALMVPEMGSGEDDDDPESSAKEIDPDDYQMGHRCPKCGFEFDD